MVSIKFVDLKTEYIWDYVKDEQNWNKISIGNTSWNQVKNTAYTGSNVLVYVEVSENTWQDIKSNGLSWNNVTTKFKSWSDIKKY